MQKQVGRADILRALAVSRTACTDTAAKLAGYLPAQGEKQEERETITRSSITSHTQKKQAQVAALNKLTKAKEISRKLPSEAFWYLLERKERKQTLHRVADSQEFVAQENESRLLPGVLRKSSPLTSKELFLPAFTPCPHNSSELSFSGPPVPVTEQQQREKKSKPDMERLVRSASELISLRQKKSKRKR
ncbi:MAG: hypothetical protein D3909_06520, partial [Candidatus Electrothrix sp. ATG1]|nr:hypothetical protein [Candidatus Electrothrix sp. ATG1]